jgi:Trk K+ transport system NAD-binding subunit
VLSIDRHSQLIAPQPDTPLHAGDVIVAVAPATTETELRHQLDTETAL